MLKRVYHQLDGQPNLIPVHHLTILWLNETGKFYLDSFFDRVLIIFRHSLE